MQPRFPFLQFFKFAATFAAFVVFGTLLHEAAHFFAAKYFGYAPTLHFASVNDGTQQKIREVWMEVREEFPDSDYDELPSPEREKIQATYNQLHRDQFWITLAGPAQTMLTGLFGLMLIFIRNLHRQIQSFKRLDWLVVFLSLFWLRQVFNPVYAILKSVFFGRSFGESHSDEVFLSKYFGFPPFLFDAVFGFIGLAICGFVIFRVVPKIHRFTFVFAGLVGGLSGYLLWMNF